MAELSDSFKQFDTVGKLRYKEKLGMLGVPTTDPYSTSEMFGLQPFLLA